VLPESAARKLYASESDIMDMQANGLEFGFHTRDHYNLRNCSARELDEQLDVSGCQQVMIERKCLAQAMQNCLRKSKL